MLKLSNLSKTFNPGTVNEKRALSNVNLELAMETLSPFWAPTGRENPRCSTPLPVLFRWTRAPSAWTE